MLTFTRALRQAVRDNEKLRLEAETRVNPMANLKLRPSVSGAIMNGNPGASMMEGKKTLNVVPESNTDGLDGSAAESVNKSNNLFADYHSFQTGTVDAVLAGFKKRQKGSGTA